MGSKEKTEALVKHADHLKKVRDQAAKEFPDSVSATPTMQTIIDLADKHTEKLEKAGKAKSGTKASGAKAVNKIHDETVADMEAAGISVGDVDGE